MVKYLEFLKMLKSMFGNGNIIGRHKVQRRFWGKTKWYIKNCYLWYNNILFIDEIHTVIGAGATSGGSIDASNILKPALANGSLCIGSTTYTEYRKYFGKDSALVRRFQKVDIENPVRKKLY